MRRCRCYFSSKLLVMFSLLLLFGIGLADAKEEDRANLISVENGGQLVESAGNLPDWPDEDWNGAIDGGWETWAETVTAFNSPQEGDDHPWAIFAFENEKVQVIDAASFFMLTKAAMDENLQTRCGKDFQILVSTKETKEDDFELALEDTIDIDINTPFADEEWMNFTFDPVRAKYVKLVFLSNYGEATYTTLGEFAVYASLAVRPLGKASTTWGEIKSNR
jgi:hypothetical protein